MDVHSTLRPRDEHRSLKGVDHLPEASRFWHLWDKDLLDSRGFFEPCCARAVFVMRVEHRLPAILTLHLDFGMLIGNREDEDFQVARKCIDGKFIVIQWATTAFSECGRTVP